MFHNLQILQYFQSIQSSTDVIKRRNLPTLLNPVISPNIFFTWIDRTSISELSEFNLSMKNGKIETHLLVNGELLEARKQHLNVKAYNPHKLKVIR